MALLKCKMCGGDLNLIEGETVCECEYCGTRQTVPTIDEEDNEKKIALFTRANRLRFNSEFDRAYSIYETITIDFPEEPEAYWGLVLCKYGIEYVDDPATYKKVPTCHRSSFESVYDDPNYEFAIDYSDTSSRVLYREEAKTIEEIRKGIIEISSKEDPYDIFICYKETDENGGRTVDSVVAQDVYDLLTNKGYRVFFARISLEDKLGTEYEPYIFSALHSSRIMLAFGTDYEYFNAVWVKNEWSRFLKLIEKDKKKTLIPCYKDMDAYDMPKEFRKLQAQDMGKVGAMQDLLRGIEKILPLKKQKEIVKETVILDQSMPVTGFFAPMLKKATFFLKSKRYEEAKSSYSKVLDFIPDNDEALLGMLLAAMQISSFEELENGIDDFTTYKEYEDIYTIASDELKGALAEAYQKIDDNIRMQMQASLLEKDFVFAVNLATRILSKQSDDEGALLVLLFCEMGVSSFEELECGVEFFTDKESYKALFSACSEELSQRLATSHECIKQNIYNEMLRAFENKEFYVAETHAKTLLQFDPKNEELLISQFLAESRVSSFEGFDNSIDFFTDKQSYATLIENCSPETIEKINLAHKKIINNLKVAIRGAMDRRNLLVAKSFAEKLAIYEPENEELLITLFFIEMGVATYKELEVNKEFFLGRETFKKLIAHSSTETREILKDIHQRIKRQKLLETKNLLMAHYFDKAKRIAKEIYSVDHKNDTALMYILLAEAHVSTYEELWQIDLPITKLPSYNWVLMRLQDKSFLTEIATKK